VDRATSENPVTRLTQLLVLVSGIASTVASAIYLLAALASLYRFHGLIQGYYSLLNYRLLYAVDQQPVSMPHTDYVRHVSLSFAASSLAVLLISVASVFISRWRLQLASGLVFGSSSALILLYGLFNGYIRRAVGMDIERFSSVLGDRVAVETLAGRVVFTGVQIEPTWVTLLVVNTQLMLALVVAAVAASFVSAVLVSPGTAQRTPVPAPRLHELRLKLIYVVLLISVLSSYASVFTYQPSTVIVNPQPPPATLEAPLHDYTCTALTRTSRGAVAYTDFEVYPVPGWTNYGGVWGLSAGGGFKGNALRGRDNNGGVGGQSSQYYWNTRIDSYTSLWVSVKVRAETSDGYKGIGLLNADRSRLYEVSVQSTATIYKWDRAWRLLGSTSVPGYSATRWYTLVLNYSVAPTAVTFTLWIYNETGALVATLTASDTGATRFTPAYAGVTVDAGTTLWFRFEDFIVSTVDPRSVYFAGFYTGMGVEVWDNLGYPVNSTTAPAPSFALGVVSDVVVGTGSNGRLVVKYPDAYLCGVLAVPTTDAVLGGDTFTLSTQPITLSLGANKTSTSLSLHVSGTSTFNTTARILRVNAFQLLYARLVLDTLSAPSTLNLDVWIEGATNSTSISVRNGVPVATSTSIVQLNPGLGNTIHFSGYFASTSQSAVLNLKLELCTTATGAGACVCYPLNLTIHS